MAAFGLPGGFELLICGVLLMVLVVVAIVAVVNGSKANANRGVPVTAQGGGTVRFCSNCGAQVGDAAAVCVACGASVSRATAVSDAPNTGFAVLGFFFPIVGLILYLVWKDQTPLKASSAGKGALIGFILNIVAGIAYGIAVAVLMSSY